MEAKSHASYLNRKQIELREIMLSDDQQEQAIQLFMIQHALLHAQNMAQTESWSYKDEVFNNISDSQMRCIPQDAEHSAGWILWHITRCEDITMNLLVAGESQVLHEGDWMMQMKTSQKDTGNAMTREEIADFSAKIGVNMLRAYRLAVGRRTREIVTLLPPDALKQKVEPALVQRVFEEGAVVESAKGVAEYWGKRTVAGLLLMPATRHHLTHFNEVLKLKSKFP